MGLVIGHGDEGGEEQTDLRDEASSHRARIRNVDMKDKGIVRSKAVATAVAG